MQRHGPIRPLHVTLTIYSVLYDIHQERNYNLKDAR